MADPILKFFTSVDNEGGVVVREHPKIDLDLYIQNYKGRTRFDRLLHIGRTSVVLCVDALKAAVVEAKKGRDLNRYRDAWDCIRVAAPSEPEAVFDRDWVDATEKANKQETFRLEAELRGYKNNLIKESIRMGHEDLGKHLESIGDFDNAMEYYAKMRPDVSTSKHIIDAHKRLVSVAFQRREWGMVLVNVAKMQGHQGTDEEKNLLPYIAVCKGIALLGQEKYSEAAQQFLDVDPTVSSNTWNDIASPNDVAIYGALLALGSMDRITLRKKVLENASFRNFLELEPQIRKAVSQFVNGRYAACIAILESYRPDYLLDIYLQRHIPTILSAIRSKCIIQYLIPFSCATLDSLNANFARPGQSIEQELILMIELGQLDARINTIDKLVTTASVNTRSSAQYTVLETARIYEKEALERLRRMSVAAADLEVKGSKKLGLGLGLGGAEKFIMDDVSLT